MKILIVFLISLFLVTSCTPSPSNNSNTNVGTTKTFTWTHTAPETGFVSSIKFHPTQNCVVWASGDDMSGLYKSTNCGQSWTRITTPQNISSYSLAFDPTDSNKIYAANHFGLGMLKSVDGGLSWSLQQAGLPTTINNRRLFQTAINPLASNTIIIAAQDGLYRSTDQGQNFSKLTISWGSQFMAAVYTSTGRLIAGATNGVFKYSDNNGTTWTDLLTASLPIVEMQASQNALYVLYADATLQYFTLPNFAAGNTINLGSTQITTSALATLTVVSGANQASDTLYLGTSKATGLSANRWGLFKSTNGGSTWNQLTNNLTNVSIFRIAVNPNDSQNVLVTSSSSAGIYRSTDGGSTFNHSSSGIQAVSALGFAQNPMNTQELALSSSVGLGMSQMYRSLDNGSTWSVISEVNSSDGTLSINFDPQNSGHVLTGMFSTGLYKSTTGITGSFSRIINTNTKITKIIRDQINSNLVYALAIEGTPSTDARLYYSNNSGHSFTIRNSAYATDLAPHPTVTNESVMTSINDAYASTDGFSSSMNSLNLTSQATAQNGLSAVAFDPQNPSTIWIGGSLGGLYRTNNYQNSGSGITWQNVSSPISNAIVSKILIRYENSQRVVYVSSFGGDIYWNINGTLGLFRSTDDGTTWTNISSNLSPCTSFWNLHQDLSSTNGLWGSMWGGGLKKLSF